MKEEEVGGHYDLVEGKMLLGQVGAASFGGWVWLGSGKSAE